MSIFRVLLNSGAQIFVKIVSIFIGILVVKLLTSYLEVEGYGIYAKIHNYCAIFAALADLGLFSISVKQISSRLSDTKYVRLYLSQLTGVRIALGVFFLLLSLVIALFLPGYSEGTLLLYILITQLFVICGLVFSSYLSYLQAGLISEKATFSSLFGRGVALLSVVVVVLWLPVSLSSQLLLIFLGGLLGNIFMVWMLLKKLPANLRCAPTFSFSFLCDLLRTNIFYIISIFLGSIFLRVDVFMVSLLLDGSGGNFYVGTYSVAAKIIEIGVFAGMIVMNSFLPLFVQKISRWNNLFAFFIMSLGGAVFASMCFFFSEFIITLISDSSFVSLAGPVLGILGWSVLFHYLGIFFSFAFFSDNRFRSLCMVYTIVFLINISLNYYFILSSGLIGAAWATFWSQLCFCMLFACLYLWVYRHSLFGFISKSIQ